MAGHSQPNALLLGAARPFGNLNASSASAMLGRS
jgi:hypothetical protein